MSRNQYFFRTGFCFSAIMLVGLILDFSDAVSAAFFVASIVCFATSEIIETIEESKND